MLDPSCVEEAHGHPEAVGANDHDRAVAQVIGAALLAAARAAQGLRLYGPDHPTVAAACNDTLTAFADPRLAHPIVTGVFSDRFTVGEAPISSAELLRELAGAFHRADFAAVEWTRPGGEEQVTALVRWLMAISSTAGDAAAAAAHDPPSCARPFRLAAHSLRFVPQATDVSDRNTHQWKMVVYSVLSGGGAPNGALTGCIDNLSELLAGSNEAESEAARTILQEMAHPTTNDSAEPRPRRSPGVGHALTGLRPELKEALIGVAAAGRHDWLESNLDSLDVRSVAEQLFVAEEAGARPSEASFRLLQKLLGCTGLEGDVRERTDALASRWAPPQGSGEATPSAIRVLHDLLTSDDPEDYCPDDYAGDLSTAARDSTGPARAMTLDWPDPTARIAEIALALLQDPAHADDPTAPIEGLARELPDLLASGRLELIEQAAASCERIAQSEHERARAAVARLRAALSSPAMLDGLLSGRSGSATNLSSLCLLLGIAPIALLKRLTDLAGSAGGHADRTPLALTARTLPPSDLRDFIRDEIAPAPALHEGHEALLSCVEPDRLLFVCEPLFESGSPVLRARALVLLDGRLTTWPARLLLMALGETDPAIAAIGARRLSERPDACGIEPLASILEAGAHGQPLEGSTLEAVVDALTKRGNEGILRLTAALGSLQRSMRKCNIFACRRIVGALESHIDIPEVRRALSSWRRSRAYTIGMFVGDGPRSRAA